MCNCTQAPCSASVLVVGISNGPSGTGNDCRWKAETGKSNRSTALPPSPTPPAVAQDKDNLESQAKICRASYRCPPSGFWDAGSYSYWRKLVPHSCRLRILLIGMVWLFGLDTYLTVGRKCCGVAIAQYLMKIYMQTSHDATERNAESMLGRVASVSASMLLQPPSV